MTQSTPSGDVPTEGGDGDRDDGRRSVAPSSAGDAVTDIDLTITLRISQKRDSVIGIFRRRLPVAKRNVQMATELVEQRVDALRGRIVALVRRDGPDLSARQMGVFLTSYLDEHKQSVGWPPS